MAEKRGPEWVKEERQFGLNNKTLAEATSTLKEKFKGLEDAKIVVFSGSGGYYSRRTTIKVVGWRKKTAEELVAEERRAREAEERKAKKAAEAADRKARQAAEAKERAKRQRAEEKARKEREAGQRARQMVKDVESMKKLLRSIGYEVKKGT